MAEDMDYNPSDEPWMHTDYDPYEGMDDDERIRTGCLQMAIYIGMMLFGLVACAIMNSCTATKYVTVPEVHEIHHHHTDSIREKDSTYHEKETVVMQLDSAAMARFGIQLQAQERAWLVKTLELERQLQQLSEHHTDTVHEIDSIPVPYPVEVEVERKLTWWQKAKMNMGVAMMGALGVLGIVGGIMVKRKYIK